MSPQAALLRLVALLFLASLPACASRRTGEAVKRITFQVEGRPFPKSLWVPQSNRALRKVMDQEDSSWQAFLVPGAVEPEWLDRSKLKDDEDRLEVWFAEHGYFDAKFERWEFTLRGDEDRDVRPVIVKGYIDQGEPSRVRTINVSGAQDMKRGLARRLRSAMALNPGKVFSTDDYDSTLTSLRRELLDAGYAFAKVEGQADAFPDQRAVDVQIVMKPGPKSKFGPITIKGVEDMPKDVVEHLVTFEAGDTFSPREIADTRTALFGLRVFSVVDVTPQLDNPESAVVPVLIEVKSTKWRRLEAGPGVEIESGKGTIYGTGRWTNNNLFHRLWRFEQSVKAGVAGVVAQDTTYDSFSLSQVTIAPVGELESQLTVPEVIGPNWSFDVQGKVEMGLEPGYRFFSPEVAPSLTWQRIEDLDVTLGYRVRYFNYFDFTIDIHDIEDSPLGLDLTDPYLLSLLEQHLTLDKRDDQMMPTRGWYGSLATAEAGGLVFGNFNFLKAEGELRKYTSAPRLGTWDPKLVLATRLGTGIITPYGESPKNSVPYAERLYLGGGTTVRGWASNRMGELTETTHIDTGVSELVPAGGLYDLFGNIELRKSLGGGVTLAGFSDFGWVWPNLDTVALQDLQWSVGGGLRYATAIGPVRGDFGWRLGDDYPNQPRWAVHFGLSEAF